MIKKKRNLLFIALMVMLVGCSSSQISLGDSSAPFSSEDIPTTYENPVWEPVLADPSIIRGDDGTFYAFGTQDNAEWGDYYGTRYIPILTSPDLVNWTYADQVFRQVNMPTWGTLGAGLWAPDIVKIGETYTLYYSLSTWGDPNPGIGVATADHPLGPWTDHGKLFDSNLIGVGNSIDPAVVVDAQTDRVYMVWGSFIGIYGVELTSDGLALKDGENASNTKVLLAGIDNGRWDIMNYEGAYIIKIEDYYYMFLSSGTCCEGHNSSYRVVVSRATAIMGPYVDRVGNFMANTSGKGTPVISGNYDFVGVGHNSVIVDDAGDYWLVYHGFDLDQPARYGTTNRRSLLIDKLVWTNDDWPYVQDYGASTSASLPTINPQ
jgi:arabinan endo-1,5-alpha-L-arabinosidase